MIEPTWIAGIVAGWLLVEAIKFFANRPRSSLEGEDLRLFREMAQHHIEAMDALKELGFRMHRVNEKCNDINQVLEEVHVRVIKNEGRLIQIEEAVNRILDRARE